MLPKHGHSHPFRDTFATGLLLAGVPIEDVSDSGILTVVSPANVWLGLKNGDDVGTNFDLLAEVLKNGVVVGSGQLNSVPGGSSGFNNAVQRAIVTALAAPVSIGPGDALAIRVSVRIGTGVGGHRSGTARLWFGDATANSRVGAVVNVSARWRHGLVGSGA